MSHILGINVQSTTYDDIVAKCVVWAQRQLSRSLVFANVHVIMEAYDNSAFREKLNQADVINPDGVPLVWALRLLGNHNASRVYGPDFTCKLLEAAARHHLPVAFFGGSPKVLQELTAVVEQNYSGIDIAIAISPPFRALTCEENRGYLEEIRNSGARILLVGLGCPKQEHWMMDFFREIPAVTCAVGAAFDFLAGTKLQAPRWMMSCGLEWLFRLMTEPKRLFRRYARHNPRFLYLLARQLMFPERMTAVKD